MKTPPRVVELFLTSAFFESVGKKISKAETRNNTLQPPNPGFSSGKYDQIFPVVSPRTPAFFQAMERSINMASPSRLCKHGMALITDAYFGVTSEAACLLFVSALCFPG